MGGACSEHGRNIRLTFWLENLGVDGRITLQLILGKSVGKVWTGFTWLRIRTSGGSCEHSKSSIKGGEFLD